jgi:hypothetical protein
MEAQRRKVVANQSHRSENRTSEQRCRQAKRQCVLLDTNGDVRRAETRYSSDTEQIQLVCYKIMLQENPGA